MCWDREEAIELETVVQILSDNVVVGQFPARDVVVEDH